VVNKTPMIMLTDFNLISAGHYLLND
jgi:hypothetical protein